MKFNRLTYIVILVILLILPGIFFLKKFNSSLPNKIGEPIDSFNGVSVFYNGWVSNISGRNTTKDGYNLGLKYQCVEFVKRYYYEALDHKMPNSFGNAKDFFDHTLKDGQKNLKRNLVQYKNRSISKPKIEDLLIFNGTTLNKYGHVAIISNVTDTEIEIIQQNGGTFKNSRETFYLQHRAGKWEIQNERILGWLRKK